MIPFGPVVDVPFSDVTTPLQLTDMPVAVLFVLAIASIGIYGIVLGGWSSGSTYSLLGGLRSSAQMISYEVAMGLALVAVFLYAGSMSTSEIVAAQEDLWFGLILVPSFVIYMIAMVGETNRAPFDLPEAEGELVGGFHTEYSSLKFALFFLAEYINMATVSALATTLFLGGWHAPWGIVHIWQGANEGYWPLLWFFGKVLFFIFIFIWLRGSLPRLRYDQFMAFGWKRLIPIALLWIVAVATIRSIVPRGRHRPPVPPRSGIGVLAVLFLVLFFVGEPEESDDAQPRRGRRAEAPVDAYAGGFPVPPMPAGGAGPRRRRSRSCSTRARRSPPAPPPPSEETDGRSRCRVQGLKEQFWDPVAGFGVTFRTMFRKVVTEQYPFEKLPTAPRFHGRHQLNRWPDGLEKCIGCELCAWACPADAIYVEGASNTERRAVQSPGERYGRVYQINYLRCILCGLCIEACPTRALTMTNEYELADDNRADLIYEKSDLLAPLLPGMEQPPHPMRLGDDEGDYYRGNFSGPRGRRTGRTHDLLDPRADHGAGRARHPVRPQGRARRAAARRRDDQPRGAVRRARGAVPVRGADHRLHRRDPDAVPVRADAGRRRRLRLGGRDDQGPAGAGRRRRPAARRWSSSSRSARSRSAPSSASTRPTRAATSRALANILFSRYVFAFEATSALLITAAIGAMVLAHRERLTPKPTQADAGRPADAGLRRVRQAPRAAAVARRLRPAQRRRHPGAAARRHRRPRPRCPGCSPPAAPCAPRPRWPTTSRSVQRQLGAISTAQARGRRRQGRLDRRDRGGPDA